MKQKYVLLTTLLLGSCNPFSESPKFVEPTPEMFDCGKTFNVPSVSLPSGYGETNYRLRDIDCDGEIDALVKYRNYWIAEEYEDKLTKGEHTQIMTPEMRRLAREITERNRELGILLIEKPYFQ